MLQARGLSLLWQSARNSTCCLHVQLRSLHYDGRNRLSSLWTPTQNGKQVVDDAGDHGQHLLLRAGFLRQAHSGIFHLLPLGLRVQDKIERLLDKHMQSLGASKVSLSSLSSQELWLKSGRLNGRNAELFQLKDRKESAYLLAPTHEEEITTIVKNAVHSYKDLPLRLYQISRKYRDEARPRQGLLRGREFVMKDMYTFDANESQALETYELVCAAYRAFLDDLKVPYLVATADSGNMGGSHSHEYHFPTTKGEDTIITCTGCGMSINEELYRGHASSKVGLIANGQLQTQFQVWHGWRPAQQTSKQAIDGEHSNDLALETPNMEEMTPPPTLVEVYLPNGQLEPNIHAIKSLVPGLDTTQSSDILDLRQLIQVARERDGQDRTSPLQRLAIRDPRVPAESIESNQEYWNTHPTYDGPPTTIDIAPFLLTRADRDAPCPKCHAVGTLHIEKAVEIGHTFHLGKRYSTPLQAMVMNEENKQIAIEMGCHGIGVSRLIGAMASLLADDRGLNWPTVIAPFEVLIVGAGNTAHEDVAALYDRLRTPSDLSLLDVVIDDRSRPFGWKLKDADLIGYPFILVMGRAWKERQMIELQCRRLGIRDEVRIEDIQKNIRDYSRLL